MVKTTPTPIKTVKAVRHKRSVDSEPGGPEDPAGAESSELDDEEFAECLADHEEAANFDDHVDRCFIIPTIGEIREVACKDRKGVETRKDVYNVNLITPIGEAIQLTAWEGLAHNVYDWFL
jgi:hypothetical protein